MQQFAYSSRQDNSRTKFEPASVNTSRSPQNLFNLALLVGLAAFLWSDKFKIVVLQGEAETLAAVQPLDAGDGKIVAVAAKTTAKNAAKNAAPAAKTKKPIGVPLPAGAWNNIAFAIDPGFSNRNAVPHTDLERSQSAVREYLRRYQKVAVAEMEKFGIPASITLAQGLLESNAGESKLARATNNHFGMKCFSRNCKKGHCANFTDDTHKDFFKKFGNSWQSFRAHSEFLAGTPRYAELFKLSKTDFPGWARGLAKAGYATDKKYGDKLIAIIHNLNLEKYDRLSSVDIP